MSDTPRQRIRLTPEAAADASKGILHVAAAKQGKDGKRPPGRPVGSLNRLSRAAVEAAQATGEMPHMFLLRIMRGEVVSTDVMNPETGQLTKVYQVPDLPMRMDAAKAAAPFFVPKLQAVEVSQALSDEELDDMLKQYGAQAGLSIAARTAAEDEEGDDHEGEGWLPEPEA